MGGIFGVATKKECVKDLYFGTDYHSHLGTAYGGMAVWTGKGFIRATHNIQNAQFRNKLEDDLAKMVGPMGIGCISDTEPQPLCVRSHIGDYALVTVGRINNMQVLMDQVIRRNHIALMEMDEQTVNPTELTISLINEGTSIVDGLQNAQQAIEGSMSMLALTPSGIYAARDAKGRTPLFVGQSEKGCAISLEPSSFPNLGYQKIHELGPGEIVFVTADGMETIVPAKEEKQICAFLWVYYGYPSSTYEGVNVEQMRYRNGAAMAEKDDVSADMVAGIPDSGIAHAIGYANRSHIPYGRPFVKYTPTWPRSFMPSDQSIRELVARMKLLPVYELVFGKRIIFCDDSIVRGTQLRETVDLLYDYGIGEMHMRTACPPLIFACRYLNFSRGRTESELIARKAVNELTGNTTESLDAYSDSSSSEYACMLQRIRKKLNFSSLKYQTLEDMLNAIGLDKKDVCTYCWDGKKKNTEL